MRYFAVIAVLLVVAMLAACGGQGAEGLKAGTPPFNLGPLPDDSRTASTLSSINGADTISGLNVDISGTSAVLDPGEKTIAWAMYSASIPAGAPLNRIDIYFDALPHEVWLALADYGMTGTWQWFGPETGDFGESFGSDYARYLSPGGNLNWVVLEVNGGTASLNHTQVDYTAPGSLMPPPPGTQTVFSGIGHTPSLVMMDSIDLPGEKAPVIAYTRELGPETNTKLRVAYYDGSAWVDTAVQPLKTYVRPRALWLPNAGKGVVVAYNSADSKMQELIFNSAWQFESVTDIPDPSPGMPFFNSALDVDPNTEELGLAHSYVGTNSSKLYYSWTEGGVWQTSDALFNSGSDGIAGVCFRFDPEGGDPWMFYSHGTIDTADLPQVNMAMEMGRLNSGTWTFTPVDYTDPDGHTSPLRMSLLFDGTTPVLAFASVRDWTSMIPGFTVTTSLLLDGVVGRYDGAWSFTKVHTATLDYSFEGFPFPDTIIFTLDEAIELNWPQLGDLQFTEVQGDVSFDILSQSPTGGTFNTSVQYRVDNAGSWEESPYFTGDPGREFSWQLGTLSPVCAYIASDSVDYQDVLNGNWEATGDVLYWSPAS